ncbi:hypothetical protein [Streptomyces sp. NPDC048644]|uniref:hypothetical protein n=1 Tax=Streptomyces sp. NPDC048644 TaxID=3365582 RepID=UPI0037214A4B
MAKLRAPHWVAVALAGCAVGIGAAWTVPALANQSAVQAAPQYKLVLSSPGTEVRAFCPAGYTVTGGGYAGSSSPALASVPLGGLDGWYARAPSP